MRRGAGTAALLTLALAGLPAAAAPGGAGVLSVQRPAAGAELSGVSLPVAGRAQVEDPLRYLAVAELAPARGARVPAWAQPVMGLVPLEPDGRFELQLLDVRTGSYELRVWVEATAGGGEKIGLVRRPVRFELRPARLEVSNVDLLRDATVTAALPASLSFTVTSDVGAILTVYVNEKQVEQVQLEQATRAFEVALDAEVNLVVVQAGNVLGEGRRESFQIRVQAPGVEAALAQAPRGRGAQARAAFWSAMALAQAGELDAARADLQEAREELGAEFYDPEYLLARLEKAHALYEKLRAAVGEEGREREALQLAQALHQDILVQGGYRDSKALEARAQRAAEAWQAHERGDAAQARATAAGARPAGEAASAAGVAEAREACARRDHEAAVPLLLELLRRQHTLVTEDMELAICAAQTYQAAGRCDAALPMAVAALRIAERARDVTEMQLVRGECELDQGRRSQAAASFARVIRRIAAGGARATPEHAARAARGAVTAAADAAAARAALAACEGRELLCTVVTRVGERALARQFTGRLDVFFSSSKCRAEIYDAAGQRIAEVPGQRRKARVEVPADALEVVFRCPEAAGGHPARYEVTVPRGGTAVVPPESERNPFVSLRVLPEEAAFAATVSLDGQALPARRGVYLFDKREATSTHGLRVEAEGRHPFVASVRLSKIDEQLSVYLPAVAAVRRFDSGVEALRAGQVRKATSELDAALGEDAGFAMAGFMLGVVQLEAGDRAGARRSFDRCARLDNDTRYATLGRAWLAVLDFEDARAGRVELPALEAALERLRRAYDEVSYLYEVMPSMDREPVPYRDDALRWVARAAQARWRAARAAGEEAATVQRAFAEAVDLWSRLPSQIVAFRGRERVSYDSPYKAEKDGALAELQGGP